MNIFLSWLHALELARTNNDLMSILRLEIAQRWLTNDDGLHGEVLALGDAQTFSEALRRFYQDEVVVTQDVNGKMRHLLGNVLLSLAENGDASVGLKGGWYPELGKTGLVNLLALRFFVDPTGDRRSVANADHAQKIAQRLFDGVILRATQLTPVIELETLMEFDAMHETLVGALIIEPHRRMFSSARNTINTVFSDYWFANEAGEVPSELRLLWSELMLLWQDMAYVFKAVGQPPTKAARPLDDETVALARAFHKHALAYSQLAGGIEALKIEEEWEEQIAPVEDQLPWVPEARYRRDIAASLIVERRGRSSIEAEILQPDAEEQLDEAIQLLSRVA